MREPFDDFQDYYIEKTNTVRFEVIQFTKSIEMGQITQEFKQYDYASITGESISIKEYPKHNIYIVGKTVSLNEFGELICLFHFYGTRQTAPNHTEPDEIK